MIDKKDIDRIRDTPIEQVAEALGLSVSHHKTLCPFHDDTTPSLTFNRGKNTYRCYVCGAHGGPIDLVMNKLHKSFPDACRWLADDNHITLTSDGVGCREEGVGNSLIHKPSTFNPQKYLRYFEHPWLNDAAIKFLYTQRHIDPRVVRWCRLNSYRDKNGTNWLQIPYYSQEGLLTGVQSRNLDYGKNSLNPTPSPLHLPRFRFPKGSECHIYNLPVLRMLKEGEPLYITEGCSDCWSMLSSGHKAVAIPSATLMKPADLEPIKHLNLHMYPDQDAPGANLYLMLKDICPQLVHHQLPEGCKDYSDYYLNTLTP